MSGTAPKMALSLELVASIADLQLGNDTMSEWLLRLCKLTDAAGAYSINWKIGKADNGSHNGSDDQQVFPTDWLGTADKIIRMADFQDTGMLDELAQTTDLSDMGTNSPLNDRNLMIGVIRTDPICTLLILRCDDRPDGWSKADRGFFSTFLPALLKGHLVHKELTMLRSHLEIANKVIDGSPRGIIAMTADATIIQANKLALNIIASNTCFSKNNNGLHISEPTIGLEIEAKFAEIRSSSLESLAGFVWNRSFVNEDDDRTFQIALHAHAVDHWYLAAGGDDRFLVLYINELGAEPKPSPQQLKDFHNLTTAQARLVASLLEGNSIKSAAEDLGLSIHTVRSHLRSIYKRLGVENNADLLRHVSTTLVNYRS